MADPDDGAGAAFIDDADGEMGEGSPGLFILDLLRDSAADPHLMELAEKVCVHADLVLSCVDMLISTGSGAMCGWPGVSGCLSELSRCRVPMATNAHPYHTFVHDGARMGRCGASVTAIDQVLH